MADAEPVQASVQRAFGADNRARLLERYFQSAGSVTSANAWQHVYRLLLWIDRTTGLAHAYESDKSQPGRPWYARTLAFHDWLSLEMSVDPGVLGMELDFLFKEAAEDLARSAARDRRDLAEEQRRPYEGRDFPVPGEDPELVEIIATGLEHWLAEEIPDDTWRSVTERIHAHIGQENKRANIVGEGFEDTLAAIIRRLPGAQRWTIRNRVELGDIPGFNPQSEAEKRKKVDLVLWDQRAANRILVTAKWSVRSDREEQFRSDFEAYVRLNAGRPFRYVLVTNEFDAARLKAACESVGGNAPLFERVVHVNPRGVLAAYGDQLRRSAKVLPDLVGSLRLVPLSTWLEDVLH